MDSSNSITPGRITHLAGPSSSGKTTSTKTLEAQGWLRLEMDAERNVVQVRFLERDLLDKLAFIKSHLNERCTDRDLMTVVYGDKLPDLVPKDRAHFEEVRKELLAYVDTRHQEIDGALILHLLEKAQELSKKGTSVILDDVPLLNDPRIFSHEVTRDPLSPNFWCFRDVKIEQQLKFVPIEILMRNLMRRNVNPMDHRDMERVLVEQYSTRFVAATQPDQETLGELRVATLIKWVERAVKISFFDFAKGHALNYDGKEDIDEAIQKRLEALMTLSEASVEIPEDRVTLRQRQKDFPKIQEKIDATVQTVLHNMGIPDGAEKVTLTYVSASGIRPTIIRDTHPVVQEIMSSSGSMQEIREIFSKLSEEERKNVPFLMGIATELIRQDRFEKASLLFSLLPPQNEGVDTLFLLIGKAYLEKKESIQALNYAYNYLACIKYNSPSPPEELESLIQSIIANLERLGASQVLDCIKIREVLGSIQVGSVEELHALRLQNPTVESAFMLAETLQKQLDHDPEKPLGELVTIESGGETLAMHVKITGERKPGEPLVILEGGLGLISSDWHLVQKDLPSDIQVMSYDRAGMGWSSKSQHEPSAEQSLVHLEVILKKLGLEPPYLFVGHSYGGFLGQQFALKHPAEMSGIVLVDSAIEGHQPGGEPPKRTAYDYLPQAAQNNLFNERVQYFDEQTRSIVSRVTTRTAHLETFRQELGGFSKASDLMESSFRENATPFTHPLKVITAAQENISGNPIEDKNRWENWQKKQALLPSRSNSGEQILAEKSDHFIMYHEPEIIVEQIRSFFKR